MVEPGSREVRHGESGPMQGRAVGRYLVRAGLGKGSQGEVYLGWDGKLKRYVAIKRLAPALRVDPVFRRRFQKEAEQTSRFADGHIAAIYDLIEQDEDIFLVMEYIDGETLRRRMERPLSLAELLSIASQCAEGLAAAEQHRIVHCDIKPENVMLTKAGQVKILDFGVAKRLPRGDSDSTDDIGKLTGGTPAYMAPEVLQGNNATSGSDVFSLGVVLYEALTGMHPFRAGNFFQTSHNILQVTPAAMSQRNPQVPPALEAVVQQMLAKDPAKRYGGAQDLLRDLRAVQLAAGEGKQPVPTPAGPVAGDTTTAGTADTTVVVTAGSEESSAEGRAADPASTRRTTARRRSGWVKPTVAAMLLAAAGAVWHWWPVHRPEAMHLAILPLSPCADDAGSRAFCDGLIETLNAKVTAVGSAGQARHGGEAAPAGASASRQVDVVPSHEIQSNKIVTAEQAQSEFGVSHVLEGSLQRADGMVRINWSLVDATTRRQIRSDTITESASDTFALQDKVVASVLKLVDLSQPDVGSSPVPYGTLKPEAYDLYLRGLGYLQELDRPDSLTSAVVTFRRALEVDPSYAQAYAGLGLTYWHQFTERQNTELARKALDACNHAIALAPALPEALVCIATVYNGTGKYDEAAKTLEDALRIEPANTEAMAQLARNYMKTGKLKEAEERYKRALQMHPQYWLGYGHLGNFYYQQGRYEDAAKEYQQVIDLAPRNVTGYSNLGAMRIQQGRYAEAEAEFQKAFAIRPDADAFSNLGIIYFYQGKFGEAAKAYARAAELEPKVFEYPGNLGEALYWVPKRGEAAPYLLKALALAQEQRKVNPKDPDPISAAATYQAMLGQNAAAMALVRRAQSFPSKDWDPEINVRLAKACALSGELQLARDFMKSALQHGYPPTSLSNDPALAGLATQMQ